MSTGQQCHLLRLPPEILLNIARILLCHNSLTQATTVDYSSLIPLSSSHPGLRKICISAGLFKRISPKSKSFKRFKEFGESLDIRCIISLGVDLGNDNVWPVCAHVMSLQHSLNELCIIGSTSRLTAKFFSSGLARRFSEFKGTSIVFRRALFTKLSIPVLASIGGSRVMSLVFDRTKLHFDPWKDDPEDTLSFPLFPFVKRIKYVGVPLESLRQISVQNFIYLFMTDCPLTHFEISFGYPARCCGQRRKDDPDFEDRFAQISNANRNLCLTMETIYDALRRYSRKSLQGFLRHELCSGVFVDRSWVYSEFPRPPTPPPFLRLKLLVLRVNDLDELMREDYRHEDELCPTTLEIPRLLPSPLAMHHHNIWQYLSFQYAFFCECECLVVETRVAGRRSAMPVSLWESATTRFLTEAQFASERMGHLRCLIVGNQVDGYNGIVRNLAVPPWRDHLGRIQWVYRHLEPSCCERILAVRYNTGKC